MTARARCYRTRRRDTFQPRLLTFRIEPGFSVAGTHAGLTWGRSSGEANLRTRVYAP